MKTYTIIGDVLYLTIDEDLYMPIGDVLYMTIDKGLHMPIGDVLSWHDHSIGRQTTG